MEYCLAAKDREDSNYLALGSLEMLPFQFHSDAPTTDNPQHHHIKHATSLMTTMTSSTDIIESAMSAMTNATSPALFDVTIVCTTDDYQAAYWMDRLSKGICKNLNNSSVYPMVLAVSEDWSSSAGAGNGLGTLYAYQKACRVAKSKYNINLDDELMAGKVSAALYHTAGKGTRLAPLPASENNNKPGVVS